MDRFISNLSVFLLLLLLLLLSLLLLLLPCFIEILVCIANSIDPDQTPRSAASDLGLRCFSMYLLWGARHKLVNPGPVEPVYALALQAV